MYKRRFYVRIACLIFLLAGNIGAVTDFEAGTLDYRESVLQNGLRVITLEDFSCPIVAVDLWYHVGSKDENPERQGFAHMFEHMMFRGTDKLGPTDHFDYIRQVGGDCNGYTSFDQTVYIETVPANQLELALWLEAERMSFLKIDQAAFETERQVVEEERRLRLNAPYGTLEEKALEELFKVHPYRWPPIGKIPHLRAATVPELRAFWNQYYVPNNATLVIAGAVKHEEARALAERYFGWIRPGTAPPRITVREPLPEEPREINLKIENAPVPLVGIAFRTVPLGHPDRVPLELLTTILGGGNSSRAYRSLVARKQLAVGVQCMNISMEQDGVIALGAAFTPVGGRMDETLAALKVELERARKRKVSAQELEKARNQMLRDLVTENLYVANKARTLGSASVLEGGAARVNERLAAVRAATTDDLQRVARQYLDPDKALTFRVERNLEGMFTKGRTNPEDEAPITGQPETEPPPPGRTGEMRPPDYPTTPPLKDALDFDPTPRFREQILKNGLKVVVVENHEVPFVSLSLHLRSGAWCEDKPGCAAMTLSMLRRGTSKHGEGELAEALEAAAINLYGQASMDDAEVSASCMTDQVERATELMAEIILTPAFDTSEFEKLRKEVITDLAINANEPSYIADREMRHRLYGEHPYARTVQGEVSDVRALTPEDARAWWSTFARPDLAWLCFSGDITMDRAAELAGRFLGDWTSKGEKPERDVLPLSDSAPTHIYLVDKEGDQSQIRIARKGITRNDPGYFTSRVVNGYFGGAFGSRLNETLRVKKGLTYGARGGYTAYRMAGEFVLSTFTKIASTPEAVQAGLEEIRRLQGEAPSQKELDHTKAYILGSFAGDRETPQATIADLWLMESEGLPGDYLRRLLEGVRITDAPACTAFARNTLSPETFVIVVVGPAAELKDKLETIAPVTVVSPEPES